jgi:hypothetical protein
MSGTLTPCQGEQFGDSAIIAGARQRRRVLVNDLYLFLVRPAQQYGEAAGREI